MYIMIDATEAIAPITLIISIIIAIVLRFMYLPEHIYKRERI